MVATVFDSFPSAIVGGVWKIGTVNRGTEVGTVFETVGELDVIVDEEGTGSLAKSPTADSLDVGTLLYVKPEQLPTLRTAELVAGYMLTDGDYYYSITASSIGKNQETGEVEHVELLISETEVAQWQARR